MTILLRRIYAFATEYKFTPAFSAPFIRHPHYLQACTPHKDFLQRVRMKNSENVYNHEYQRGAKRSIQNTI